MPIDSCSHSFKELADVFLPNYMKMLRDKLKQPSQMALFCSPGVGVQSILNTLNLSDDFSGCYVLLEGGKPFYVGISRRVIQRLHQHVRGNTHYNASLAYSMASNKFPHKMTRDKAMADAKFRIQFDQAKLLLQNSTVAFIKIDNPLELYLFEAYCAMELNTCQWNTFRTH